MRLWMTCQLYVTHLWQRWNQSSCHTVEVLAADWEPATLLWCRLVLNRVVSQGWLLAQHLALSDKKAGFPGFSKQQMRPGWSHTRSWQRFVVPVCKVVLDWITVYIEMALKFPYGTNSLKQLSHLEFNLTKMLTGLEAVLVGPDMVAHTSVSPALDGRSTHGNPQKLKGQLALEHAAVHY